MGIAEFKAHLSRYLREAKRGGAITITHRGHPGGAARTPALGRLRDL